MSFSSPRSMASLVVLNARHLQSTPMPRGEDNLPPKVVTETLQLRPSGQAMNAKVAATMSRPHPLRLLVTNAFSLCNKIGDPQHALITHNVNIAVVTETKMTIDKVTQAGATIPGYAPLSGMIGHHTAAESLSGWKLVCRIKNLISIPAPKR